MHTLVSQTTPRIYVACLAAYNAGTLHGVWIDADEGADHIREEVALMLATSPEPDAEEWAIHDFEGFGSYRLSEWEDFDTVAHAAELIAEHGEVFEAALSVADSLEHAEEMLENYAGFFSSDEDFAQELCDSMGLLESLSNILHIDWTSTARDLLMDYHEHAGHYFHAC